MPEIKKIITSVYYFGMCSTVYRHKNAIDKTYSHYVTHEQIPSIAQMQEEIDTFTYLPLISIIMPIYRASLLELSEALQSLLQQPYEHIEICLVDDGSQQKNLDAYLEKLSKDYPHKIKYKKNMMNQNIAKTSNECLELATGEYVALVDQDDVVAVHAFYEYVKALQNTTYDFMYSDEDMIDLSGRRFNPQFKPAWSPHTLMSRMYVNHLSMYKRAIVRKVGGFRSEYNGSQDFDLLLRASNHFKNVGHIPKILYHWRTSENSIATSIGNKRYIYDVAQRAIHSFFLEKNMKVETETFHDMLMYDIRFIESEQSTIDIVLQVEKNAQKLEELITSFKQVDGYSNVVFHFIVRNPNDEWMKALCYENEIDYYMYKDDVPTENLTGTYVLFINDYIIFRQEKMLEQLMTLASLKETGCVSPTMINKDDVILETGLIMTNDGRSFRSNYGTLLRNAGYYGRTVSFYNYAAFSQCVLIKQDKLLVDRVNATPSCLINIAIDSLEQRLSNVNVGQYQVVLNEGKISGEVIVTQEVKRRIVTYLEAIGGYDPYYPQVFSQTIDRQYLLKK